MLTNRKVMEGLQLSIIVGMFITAAIRWSSVPDRIPIHWNASGDVDGYGGRFVGLLLVPILALGVYALLALIPRLDPAKANYQSFKGPYLVIRTAVIAYLGFVYMVMNFAIGNEDGVPVDSLLFGSIAVLLLLLGAVMGKMRPNYFVGIRTPWTLTSKRSWIKTHRLGGWVFIVAGIAGGIGAIFGGVAAISALLGVLIPGVLFLAFYSYRVWRDDPDRVSAQDTHPGPNGVTG